MALMKIKSFSILLLLYSFSFTALSQKTYWASQIFSFSSEKVIPFQQLGHKAVQVLGKPNVLPQYTQSALAWQPSVQKKSSEEYITVGFDTLMHIQQVAVAENYGIGSIDKVIAFDSLAKPYTLYQRDAAIIPRDKGEMFNVILPNKTPYKVYAIKIVLNVEKIKDANQIDAIGISASTDPIQAMVNVAADAPGEVYRENLGKNINSRHQEFAPVISSDGKTLYYTRNYLSLFGKQGDQDVYFSVQDEAGNWQKAQNIGAPINTEDKNAVLAVSADGYELLLMNKYHPDGHLSSGISRTYRTANGWSFPEEVKIDNYYNQSPNAEFSVSADGKVMVMSIQRKNAIGSRDLYVSFRKPNNTWTEPKNLGKTVNSIEHEVTPFIAADNKTLYFSTRGFSGFGDNDIFKSVRLDDTWTSWTEPENLGPAVNTSNWDGYFTMPASGDFAYICSFSGGAKEDIYKLVLPKTAQPNPVAIVTGNVLSSNERLAIPAKLTMTARSSVNKTEIKQYEPSTGAFSFVIPLNDIYDFIPEATGFIAVNETIDLRNVNEYQEIKKDFYLIPIEVGSKGILNSFSFEQGEAKLQPSLMRNLDRIVQVMKDNPTLEILFEGHTDNQGDFQLNMKLSEDRVAAVKKYLVSQGILPQRIKTKAWGPTRPISNNANEEQRQRNRRVEFTIIKK